MSCGWRGPMDETLERVEAGEEDPPCLFCGGIIKSATISFGENLVPEDLDRSQRAAAHAEVFLALGNVTWRLSRGRHFPEIALRNGARLIIVNAEETPFDQVADAVVREQLDARVARIGRQDLNAIRRADRFARTE